jgi:hypothetical protein
MDGKPIEKQSASHRPVALGTFILAVAVVVAFYPEISTWLYTHLTARGGWDGSALGYVRFTRVLPISALLVILSVIGYVVAARRRPSATTAILIVSWSAGIVLLLISVLWYAGLADRG